MKINLILNGHPLSGYTNVDPHGFGEAGKVVGDFTNLDDIVEDSEATEILALDVIDFLEPDSIEKTISHWVSKLRRGGKIVIGGRDLWQISKAVYYKLIDIKEANEAIRGGGDFARFNQSTIQELISVLESHNLKILKKRINKFDISVEAQRP